MRGDAAGTRHGRHVDREALTDPLRCPSCGARLAGPGCGVCGADLAGPVAARVWTLSTRIAGLLDERDVLIGTLREAAARERSAVTTVTAPLTAPLTAPVAPAPVAAVPVAPVPVGPAAAAAPAVRAGGGAGGTARRGGASLGAQALLVGLGALLLAVAAVVFLVVSWDRLPLGARAAVVGLFTVTAMGLAARLRARLGATAEGLGALAVVLVVADAGAVRATGLLGADAPPLLVYAAGACAASASLLGGWARTSGVRAGSLAAAVLLPAAPVLLGVHQSSRSGTTTGLVVGLAAAAAVTGVRARLPRPWTAERRILHVTAAVALGLAMAVELVRAAGVGTRGGAATSWALLAVCLAVAVQQAGLERAGAAARSWTVVAGLVTAATALPVARGLSVVDVPGGAQGAAGGGRVSGWWVALLPALAAAAGFGLAHVQARAGRGGRVLPPGVDGPVAVRAVLSGTALAALPAVLGVLVALTLTAVTPLPAWRAGPGTPLGELFPGGVPRLYGAPWSPDVQHVACVLGLVATGLLVRAALLRAPLPGARLPGAWLPGAPLQGAGAGTGLRRAATVAVLAGLVGAPAAPALPVAAACLVWLVGAVVAVAVAVRVPAPGRVVREAVGVAVASGVLGVVVAWDVPALSVPATVLGVLGLVLARRARPVVGGGAGPAGPVLAGAATLAWAVAAGAAAGLPSSGGAAGAVPGAFGASLADRWAVAAVAATLVAAVALAVPARPRLRATAADRWATTVAALLVAVPLLTVTVTVAVGRLSDVAAGRLLVVSAVLLAAALLAARPAPDRSPAGRGAPVAAGAAVPLLAGLTAAAAVLRAGDGRTGLALALGAVTLACALALTAFGLRAPTDARRLPAETTTGVVGLAALVAVEEAEQVWLVLLLLGAGAAAVAVGPGRRGAGPLSIGLLTASSWTRLRLADVDLVEAYTVPTAVVLLALAGLRLRRDRSAAAWRSALPGACLAVVPTVVAAASGPALRPALLLLTGLAVLLAGVRVRGVGADVRRAAAVLVVTGAVVAAAAGLVRALAGAAGAAAGTVDGGARAWTAVELWSVPAAVALASAALRVTGLPRARTALAALVVAVLPSLVAALTDGPGASFGGPAGAGEQGPAGLRAAGAALVAAAVCLVAAAVARRPPLPGPATPVLRSVGTATALFSAAVGWLVSDLPAEVWTVPSGVLLVVLGAGDLRSSRVRSWPALGPGLALALLPSLVLAEDGPVLRIAALTVGAAAVVVAGTVRRLQAPLLLGGAVLAVHALVQLGPDLVALGSSVPRWVVLALVGAGLLTLGATYEQRLRDVRAARLHVAALR